MGKRTDFEERDDAPFRVRYDSLLEAGGWTIAYHRITLDTRISDGALRLYLLLHRYAQQHESAWPSRETLAQDLGVSVETVRRRLKELTEVGLIERRKERFGGTSTTYILNPNGRYLELLQQTTIGTNLTRLDPPIGTNLTRLDSNRHKFDPSIGTNLTRHEEITIEEDHDDDDDDDNKRAAEINQTPLEEILLAVWEGAVGRPASPEEAAELEALVEHCSPTKLLALIPNLALRVGSQNLTLSLLRAVAMGELSIAGLDAAMPAPPPVPEPAPAAPAPPSPSDRWGGDPVLAEVVTMYEQEIGPITQMVAEELKAMTAEVRDMTRWREAFRSAVAANVRRWSYVRACLRGDGRGRAPAAVSSAPAPSRTRAVRARVVRPEDMPPMPDEEPLPPPD